MTIPCLIQITWLVITEMYLKIFMEIYGNFYWLVITIFGINGNFIFDSILAFNFGFQTIPNIRVIIFTYFIFNFYKHIIGKQYHLLIQTHLNYVILKDGGKLGRGDSVVPKDRGWEHYHIKE